jgi:hypothetical protein
MNIDILKHKCEIAINYRDLVDYPGRATITVILPESKSAPKRRRIFGNSGPFGNLVTWGFDGYDTVIFDAQEVLDFIKHTEVLRASEAK